ncbi:VOC family protein [Halogeometricum sp. S1BR25-6]|uniref:VOC family protein n=1 Tax=Halogeometricum salsisoli TaxID=2950536 RepID=A0ABU2GGA5_9EURY|nr:VOC family protein [Halogeometricum sp. S1BR25-6]MDS0299832.1 VOC family protein [Halogeometricum sp. S1BR25-6]
MDVTEIDHANLHIPADGVESAVAFYRDRLGLQIENRELYEAGEKPFFSVRLAPGAVLHLQPDEEFRTPSGDGFDHLAFRVDADIEDLKAELDEAGVELDRELEPLGATGVAPAVYVTDPFGYTLELKATRD